MRMFLFGFFSMWVTMAIIIAFIVGMVALQLWLFPGPMPPNLRCGMLIGAISLVFLFIVVMIIVPS